MNEFFKKPVVKILMLKGEKGDKGDTGTGTPTGGKTGQYLLKKSDADYDYVWSAITTVSWDNVSGKPDAYPTTWDNVSGKTNATESASGLMSADDKVVLDGLNNNGPSVLHEYVSRPASADDIPGDDSKLKWFIFEGGYIIQFSWDNNNWASQLYIPASGSKKATPQFRMHDGDSKTWSEWIDIYSGSKPQSSVTKSFTLSASSWETYNGWKIYRITDSLVTVNSNQEVIPSTSITNEQLKALQKANLIGTQEQGLMYLWVYGEKPTIDIPITVIFRGTI